MHHAALGTGGRNGKGSGCCGEKHGPLQPVAGGNQRPQKVGPADPAAGVQTVPLCAYCRHAMCYSQDREARHTYSVRMKLGRGVGSPSFCLCTAHGGDCQGCLRRDQCLCTAYGGEYQRMHQKEPMLLDSLCRRLSRMHQKGPMPLYSPRRRLSRMHQKGPSCV